ncbi:MAG TPA: peptide deformylase, partial [Thermoleophilaceae bacterium]
MPVRDVLRVPHPTLKLVADPGAPGPGAERVARDLLDTMRSFPRCVGIAAPQIGELVRLVVVDASEHPKAKVAHGELVLVNPRVVESNGAEVAREGCLSIPDLTANVRRATHIAVEAVTPGGEPVAIETEGF